MRVLDLFCGAGGAGMGYFQADFDVIGVDIKEQPNYPFHAIQIDWKDGLNTIIEKWHEDGEDHIIHASPPCQGYSNHVSSKSSIYVRTKGKDEPRLINEVREEINKWGCPYVIENVIGAKEDLRNPILLCGWMFDLPVPRHRLFEVEPNIIAPEHLKCKGRTAKYAKDNNIEYRDMRISGKGRHAGTSDRWKKFLGVDWEAKQHEIIEMIPPAYTKYVGKEISKKLNTKEVVHGT